MASDPLHQESSVEKLIWLNRYSSFSKLVPLVLYLPFGLSLGILRFFIFLHACLLSLVLPNGFPLKRLILRVMLTVTGLPVSVSGVPVTDNKKKVVICNNVSNLDPFILSLLQPLLLTIESPTPHLNCTRSKLKTFDVQGDKDRTQSVSDLKTKINEDDLPLLFFPERLKTNGRSGVLKFSSLPFELDCPIQPVTIQAYRYLFDIHVSTHSSNIYEDLFWCFLTPMTIFSVRYLPVTEPKPEESREDFVTRVQTNMAKSLNIAASDLTCHDITEYIKRKNARTAAPRVRRVEPPAPQAHPAPKRPQVTAVPPSPKPSVSPISSGFSQEMKVMVKQVKDVLPDTPDACILSDLAITKDVDATIANILDGRVDVSKFREEPVKPLASLAPISPDKHTFKASSFASAPAARQLSFQERKAAMLEAARLKYKIKHGL